MKLLFTGASGFLGLHILPLIRNIYHIKTIGLTANDDFLLDISKEAPELSNPFDIVLHAAGKAHSVPKTEAEKKAFFDVNYQGTINLCKGLEQVGVPKSFVFISTVAVYGVDTGMDISESHPLNGDTPYAVSKIQAEKYLIDWCSKNNVILTILRPSLIAGSNAPGNLGAMVNGIKSNKYLSIGGGKARKSVLMVEDIANIINLSLNKGGIFNVCDDRHPSFRELEQVIATQLKKSLPLNVPYWFAKSLALCGDLLGNKAPINSLKLDKITKSLTFSNEKAKRELGWRPIDVISNYKI